MTDVAALVAVGAVLLLPGAALTAVLRIERDPAMSAAIAVGLSIAVWPLLFLWADQIGVVWSSGAVRAVLVVSMIAVFVSAATGRLRRGDQGPHLRTVPDAAVALTVQEQVTTPTDPDPYHQNRGTSGHVLALGVIVGIAVGVRIVQADGLVVPPWVDGLHHTEVTQRILETGGLPRSLRPYMPVDNFYYHFGFHTLAAAAAWLGHLSAPDAVLWTGQVLSGLACLTVYALARATGTRRDAALMAAAVPATLYWFPMYFLTWSRFTQLAGLVVVPIAWVLLARAACEPRRGILAAATIASAGLVLVHYRVSAFFAVGALVLLVVAVIRPPRRGESRWRPARTILIVALGAMVLASPWLAGQLRDGVQHLVDAGRQVADAGGAPTWYGTPQVDLGVPRWLFTQRANAIWLALGSAGLLVGTLRRQRGPVCVLVAVCLMVIASRPALLGLPSTWLLPGFSAAISLFIPVGVGLAHLTNAAMRLGIHRGVTPLAAARVARVTAVVATGVAGFSLDPGHRWPPRPVEVVHPPTVIAMAADVAAAKWIEMHTPPDARFLVGAVMWHLGSYRGVDGGYWLPLLAKRSNTMPGGLYSFGDPDEVRAITALAERVTAGAPPTDNDMTGIMDASGAEYVYVGPGGADLAGKWQPGDLAERPFLRQVYSRDGVSVFQRRR